LTAALGELQAELALSRDLFSTVVNATQALLLAVEEDGRVHERGVNRCFATVTGFDDHDAIGKPLWDLVRDEAAIRAGLAEASAAGVSTERESRWHDRSGGVHDIVWTARALPGLDGVFVVAGLDVTAERQQTRALEAERDFVRTVVDTAPAFFCVLDVAGGIERFNTALEESSRVRDDDGTRGRRFWDVFPDASERDDVRAAIESRRGGEQEHDWCGGRRVAWQLTLLPDGKLLVTGVDVTERRRAEREAQLHAEFLSAVGDSTPSLLAVIDSNGRIGSDGLNRAWRTLFGYEKGDLSDAIFWETFMLEQDRALVEQVVRAAAAGAEPVERDTIWVAKDGRQRHVAWRCTRMPDLVEGAQLVLVSGVDVTERRRQEDELRASRVRIVEAGDSERRRLERNLHDGAQQRLVSLSLGLRLAQAELESNPRAAAERIDALAAELAMALEDLRELARGLHPAMLTDRGLTAALQGLAARAPVPVALAALPESRLPAQVEAALYYVVAESLTNVAKYADATRATVRVAVVDGHAVAEVEDDGVGGVDETLGTGIRGLSDRVDALRGSLVVHSEPGNGTLVRAEVPLARDGS
jgi:PAS domain S-box-containing protein